MNSTNVRPEDILLYPMTMDVNGTRAHDEYVEDMALMIINMVIGYRLDYSELRKLVDYAEAHHDRLNYSQRFIKEKHE